MSQHEPTELESLVEGLAAADVIDAMTKLFGHHSHINALQGPPENTTIVGPAATVSFLPTRDDLMDQNKHSLGPAIYRALEGRKVEGAVLVMASNGHPETSLGGSTKLSRLENMNMAGVVCDGRLRDFEELGAYSFSSYCTGEAVRAGGNEIRPYLANVPVNVAGVTVIPGDIVFADETGVAIVPSDKAPEVFEMASMIKEKAAAMVSVIAAEDPKSVMNSGSSEA